MSGNTTITGDLNVNGLTELDEVSVSGVSTFNASIHISGNNKLNLGDINDYYLQWDENSQSATLQASATGNLYFSNTANGGIYLNAGTSNQSGVHLLPSAQVELKHGGSLKFTTTNSGCSVTGILTATSFSGDGGNLTGLTGASTGTYGDGGSIPVITVDSNGRITGIATATNEGSGSESTGLSSRSLVEGTTGSLAPNATGTLDLSGFKSYALMYVGLSTAGWIRIYTDSTSRTNDATRSIGDDPTPGSGVIAEVITTGISTQQNISPFVMGGNMDNPVSNTMYISITNLSSDTQAISADLTILKLEA